MPLRQARVVQSRGSRPRNRGGYHNAHNSTTTWSTKVWEILGWSDVIGTGRKPRRWKPGTKALSSNQELTWTEERSDKSTSALNPVSADEGKTDWQGETRETLLNKTDMLPSSVRGCPRVYSVPPPTSIAAKKTQAWKEAVDKRESESDANLSLHHVASAVLTRSHVRPALARLPGWLARTLCLSIFSWSWSILLHSVHISVLITVHKTVEDYEHGMERADVSSYPPSALAPPARGQKGGSRDRNSPGR